MKIGRTDVTVPMLAYSVAVLAGLIALCVMWRSHSELRLESYYRGRILRAMNGDDPAAGLEACASLLARYPDKTAARLFRANLLYRQGRYNQAEEAFAGVTALAAATSTEKAWAWVGRGVSVFSGESKVERAKSALKAELDFEEALKENKDCADALVNRAIVQLWGGKGSALDDAEAYCKQAATAASPPSLEAQGQLYVLRGVINMRKGRPDEASAFFEAAKAILPTWKEAATFQRLSTLGAAVQKDVEPARRRELLKKCESMISQFGGNQAMVLNALGVGWALVKGESEAEQQKAFKSAMGYFQKAMEANAKEPLAYPNAAALREDAIAELAGKLSGPVTGLKGETPPINKWLAGEREALRFPPQDRTTLQEITRILKEIEDIWQKYIDKVAAKPPEKVEATLWLASCLRRRAYLMEANQEQERLSLLNKALGLVKEQAAHNPDNPQAQFVLGQCLLEKEDYTQACAAYKAAASKGMKTPELSRILKGVDAKLEVVDTRPPKDRRALGQRPLVGGSLRTMGSLGVIKTVRMKIDDKETEPLLAGTQVFYLPGEKEVYEGEPKVAIVVTDAAGQTVSFPPFAIRLSTKPPSWSVQPESGKELPAGKVVFTVTLASSSGIDFGTLRLVLKQAGKSGPSLVLVSDGKCKIAMPDLKPPRKAGYPIDSDTFQISIGEQDWKLTPGDWELAISVQDSSGNGLSDAKKYTLK